MPPWTRGLEDEALDPDVSEPLPLVPFAPDDPFDARGTIGPGMKTERATPRAADVLFGLLGVV
jgi:hypothetical protein